MDLPRFGHTIIAAGIVLVQLAASTLVGNEPNSTPTTMTMSTWSQWRGDQRDGQYRGAPWPDALADTRLTENWKVSLGPSYSGPIVAEDRIFVTETQNKKIEVVRALDRSTGEELWRAEWEGSMRVPFFAASNGSWIRATPAYDGERLYVAGMRDKLVCLSAETGDQIWAVDFVSALGTPMPDFGFASSPLLHEDHVYVQAGASFLKLNKLTGKIVWRTLNDGGGMYGSAFSSPTIAVIQDTLQLVVQTRTTLAGVDPSNGNVLWKQDIPAFRGMNILTPTVIGDSVFTSSYGGRCFLFSISKEADGWDVSEAWTHKAQAYMSSPVVVKGHIYLHLRNQRFTCLDARSGEEKWTTRPFGKYWSMVANGGHILALDQRGELLLIHANADEFELVDRRRIADDSWSHVAVADDEVFVRALDSVVAFRWR